MQTESENLRMLASAHDLEGYAVFDIEQLVEGRIYPKIGLNNLSASLAEWLSHSAELTNISLFRKSTNSCLPFRWLVGVDTVTGTRLGRTIADEAFDALLEEQDFVGGYCIPVVVPGKRRSAVTFFKKRQKPKHKNAELMLEAIELFEQELASIHAPRSETTSPLSSSERSCLVWGACGKTSGEIGKLLSLSEHTVNHYFSLAGQKLGTQNRVHTVSKAIQLGLIDLSELS